MYQSIIRVNEDKLKNNPNLKESVLTEILKLINKYELEKDEETGFFISSKNDNDDIRAFCSDMVRNESIFPYLSELYVIGDDGKWEDWVEEHLNFLKNYKEPPEIEWE